MVQENGDRAVTVQENGDRAVMVQEEIEKKNKNINQGGKVVGGIKKDC